MDYILLVIGFILLVKGADIFVDGSSSIAKYFHIPAFIIGLTIVAFGTSAPEAAVSITAAVTGQNGIAVGNVIGSNLFNLLMVLGACSLIKPCPVQTPILKNEYPLSIIAAAVFIFLSASHLGASASISGAELQLSRVDGIVLLAIFVFFLISTIKKAKAAPAQSEADEQKPSLPKGILLSICGLAGIIIGGQLVVNCASHIAASFGVSQTLIGLTIVAIGTSLPELVTSIAAAVKGETDIAVGNVIGSNLFNLLFVLGSSVTIHPISVEAVSICDAVILVGVSIFAMIPALISRKIGRPWGLSFLVFYGIYTCYILAR